MEKMWEMATITGQTGKFYCSGNYGSSKYTYSANGDQSNAQPVDISTIVQYDKAGQLTWKNSGSLLTYSKGRQIPFLLENELQKISGNTIQLPQRQWMGTAIIYIVVPVLVIISVLFTGLSFLWFLLAIGVALIAGSLASKKIKDYSKELLALSSKAPADSLPAQYIEETEKNAKKNSWIWFLAVGILFLVLGLVLSLV